MALKLLALALAEARGAAFHPTGDGWSAVRGSGQEMLVADTSVDDPACVKTLCFIMNGMIPAI